MSVQLAFRRLGRVHGRRTARCRACRVPCQGTLRGPPRGRVPAYRDADGDAGAYRVLEPHVLCAPCHASAWVAYREACRDRLDLVELSATIPGVRMRHVLAARAEREAKVAREAGGQRSLFNSS